MESFDVVIVGAGIIGLSVAKALKSHQPTLRVLVCEKETSAGLHASSRNSGVLHAGFYYSPESLKAKFCRDGNRQLRDFIVKKNLPLLQVGKVVLTQSQEEEERLAEERMMIIIRNGNEGTHYPEYNDKDQDDEK